MKAMKDNRNSILGNIDIIGIFLIVIATLLIKPFSETLYMVVEAIGASFIFARIYVQFKLADTKYNKTFYLLAMIAIMCSCVSIFNW